MQTSALAINASLDNGDNGGEALIGQRKAESAATSGHNGGPPLDDGMRLAYTLDEFCRAVPCSRPTAYAAIRDGRLQAKKLGVRTLIPAQAARAFIANLPDMKAAA